MISADAPIPSGASGDDWRHTRSREASDVNAEVREAVERDGYCLFGIGLSLSEIPKGPLSGWRLPSDIPKLCSRSVNLLASDLT
jgi:hypothetical protein